MSEIEDTWREIPGYPGYLASPNQRIKKAACVQSGRRRKEQLLSPTFYHKRPSSRAKSTGPYICITSEVGRRYVSLAELMAAAFVCAEFNPRTHRIQFRDDNPKNCTPDNLMVVERY